MPAPLPDLTRDQQCHYYQAPTGQRCGSPALKGEYYCYHHHLKNAQRAQRRVLIDPEVTRMELPPIEDRASIFLALAAVVHRLAENTIDTRRAGQMIYALQVSLQALQPAPAPAARTQPATQPAANSHTAPHRASQAQTTSGAEPTAEMQPTAESAAEPSAAPSTFSIRKQDLLYFLRSRHCATCNFELFPASDLTERPHPGAPPEIIEEARPALAAPNPTPANTPAELPDRSLEEIAHEVATDESATALTLHAVAELAHSQPQSSGAPPSRASRVRVGGFTASSDKPSPHPAQETASRLPGTTSDARSACRRARERGV